MFIIFFKPSLYETFCAQLQPVSRSGSFPLGGSLHTAGIPLVIRFAKLHI